jgi:hypothetical protein
MVKLQGYTIYDVPGSCGSCPAFHNGATSQYPGSELGHCHMWDEWHKSWCTTPRRCARLFKKALTYPEGTELLIVSGDHD